MEGGGVNDKCQSTVYRSRYIIKYIYRRFVVEGGGVNDCCQYIDTTYSVESDVMCDGLMVILIINVIYLLLWKMTFVGYVLSNYLTC